MSTEWKEYRLGDLGTFKNGVNFQASKMGTGIPLVNVKDITNPGFLDSEKLDKVNIPVANDYFAENDDIFFVRSSVKREGIADVNIFKSLSTPSVHCGFIIRFRPNKKRVFPLFLYYLLKDPNYREYIRGFSSGATIINISQGALKFVILKIPQLLTQEKTAAVLSSYDDLIENNLKRIKLLEEMAQITYEEWFVRFRIDGEKLPVDKETGLPKGWELKNLGEICKLTMGQSPKSEFYNKTGNGLPFHQGVKDYGDRFPITDTWSTAGTRKAEKGDVLFSVRAPVGRLNVALEKIILGRGLASIRHNKNWNSFLLYQLQNIFFKDNLMGGGAIFDSVTKNDMMRIKLIEGDPDIMKRFNSIGESIDREIENFTIQNRILKEARDILLPRLMTGMIDVEKMGVAV